MASTRGRQVVIPLTNKSGGGVIAGDVVVIDPSNDAAFTTTTTARVAVSLGIVQETIANNAVGRVLIAGYASLVNVPASVTRGTYLETHTVARQAVGSGARRSGSSGQFLTGGATPTAWLWSKPDRRDGAAIVATVAIANTETVVASYLCTADELAAGTTFRIKAFCTQAGTNAAAPTIRVRVGPTTLTGNIAATLTGAVGTSAVASEFDALVTIRTAGASGTVIGALKQLKHAVASAIGAITSAVAVDTTVANLVELTFISGNAANTYTFQEATITKVAA